MSEPKPGQVWKDTVNGDLLLVREVDAGRDPYTPCTKDQSLAPRYARCLAFCSEGTFATMPAVKLMGTQEMQFKHFDTPRFMKVLWFKAIYYRWKMKQWVKEGGM